MPTLKSYLSHSVNQPMNVMSLVQAGLLAIFLAGCASSPPVQTTPAVTAAAREVQVIVFPGGFNWPLWVGLSQGHFAREGLDVKMTNTPNSTFQLTGLVKGDFDVAMTAIDNVIAYREGQGAPGVDGSDLVAVMGGDNGFLKLVSVPEVTAIPQLKGREVSVDSLTTGYAFVLLEILERNGLVLDRDYTTAPAGGVLQRYEQLLERKHAATMLISPFEVLARSRGMNVLADASASLGSYQGLVAGVRRSWAQQNPQVVTAYIRAYRRSLEWLYDPGNKEAAIDLFLRNVPNSTPQAAAMAYGVLLDPGTGFTRDGRLSEAGTRTVLTLREKYSRPTKKMQPVNAYYEPRYYEAAAR
jgi:ABC-type nitrate/sulfonate/bicarbonate transport system substrate-binding protein